MTPNPIIAYSPYVPQQSDIENNNKNQINQMNELLRLNSELLIKINNHVVILIFIICIPMLIISVMTLVKITNDS
jgi:hypothetical protein